MRFRVGDRVRIKSLDWYNENKDENREIIFENGIFTTLKSTFLGRIMTIEEITTDKQYILMEDRYKTFWTDEMIECKVEDETKPEPKFKVGDSVEVLKSGNTYTISQMKFNGKEFVYTLSNNGSTVSCFSEEEIEFTEEDKYWCDIMSESDPTTYVLPEGYQFVDENGNVINATKIILEKKKKEYPKTYEECRKVLGYDDRETYCVCHTGANERLFESLYRLKVCRDAYWKIAGEEMGLGKPWKPGDNIVFGIIRQHGKIQKYNDFIGGSTILEFPTEEMRDAFYENFKEIIESCKELL